jgi:hypothetical protein
LANRAFRHSQHQHYNGLQYGSFSLRANQRLQTRRAEYWHRRRAIRILDRRRSKAAASIHNPNDRGAPFLHSPIRFEGRLANELLGLGAVRHLVSPNQFHYAHIGEWAKAFPDSVSWASPRVRERARARHVDVDFTRDLEASPPEEWRREIDQTLFPGGYFKEFIFFHQTSKTLILTDTIINLELDKVVTEPWRTVTKFTGMYHPYGQIFFGMRLPLLLQRRKAEAAIRTIHAWQPQRILLSHGRCFDADADKVIRRIFGEPSR